MKTKIYNNYTVYMHKNKINSKVYIGITSQNAKTRWGLNGARYCSGAPTKFSNAIKKYGFDGFEHIILFENIGHDEAVLKEKESIEKYDSYRNGYNSTLGGDGGGFLGHHQTLESIKKSTHIGAENGMYGKKRPDYVKDAVRKAHSLKIYQYDTAFNLLKEYESGYQVNRELGFDNSYIVKRCKDHKLGYGFYWSYNILPPTTTE